MRQIRRNLFLPLVPAVTALAIAACNAAATPSASPSAYHTVVLWDTAMAHAIAAAPLR